MIYVELERAVAFEIINYRTDQQRREYDEAVEGLKNELAIPIRDQDRVDAAKEAMRDKLRELIKFQR